MLTDFQIFYCQNQEHIRNNTATKDPTKSQVHAQVCRYTTLWNVGVLKATM